MNSTNKYKWCITTQGPVTNGTHEVIIPPNFLVFENYIDAEKTYKFMIASHPHIALAIWKRLPEKAPNGADQWTVKLTNI